VMMLTMLVAVGLMAGRGWVYFAGLGVAAAMAVYQQWLIRHREPRPSFTAFLNNNYFGMAVFVGLVLDFLVNPHAG